MNRHETHAVSLTFAATALAPLFVPLLELPAGAQLLSSQCSLTVRGAPSPLEAAVMLQPPGTPLGDPGVSALYVSDPFDLVDGEARVLPGSAPLLDAAVLFGLFVAVQPMPEGATVVGSLSLVS